MTVYRSTTVARSRFSGSSAAGASRTDSLLRPEV